MKVLHGLCFALGVVETVSLYNVETGMRFPKLEHTYEDDWEVFETSPNKFRRWMRQDPSSVEHHDKNMDEHKVVVRDLRAWNKTGPTVLKNGFEVVTLKRDLLYIFERIHESGLEGLRVGPTLAQMDVEDESKLPVEELLARRLQGFDTYQIKDHVAYNFRCAGFVIRKGGPLARALEGAGFDQVAQRTHIDLDTEGEPLKRMGVQWVFKYVPFMYVLNVWTPLHTPRLRPLGLVDLETMDSNDILRYRANSTKNAGGKGGSFSSDRLMVLHNKDQEWWYDPTMGFGQAIIFLTGHTLHSSFSYKEELVLVKQIEALVALRDGTDKVKGCKMVDKITLPVKAKCPPAIYQMIERVAKVLKKTCSDDAKSVNKQLVQNTIKSIHRASLEIRCVAAVIPHTVLYGSIVAVLVALLLSCSKNKGAEKEKHA